MGGFSSSEGDLGDVLILDCKSQSVENKLVGCEDNLTFSCPNSAAMVEFGTVVALVSSGWMAP